MVRSLSIPHSLLPSLPHPAYPNIFSLPLFFPYSLFSHPTLVPSFSLSLYQHTQTAPPAYTNFHSLSLTHLLSLFHSLFLSPLLSHSLSPSPLPPPFPFSLLPLSRFISLPLSLYPSLSDVFQSFILSLSPSFFPSISLIQHTQTVHPV